MLPSILKKVVYAETEEDTSHRACIKWRAFLDTLVGFGNGNTVNTGCFRKRLAESLQWQIFPFVLIFFRCRHLKNPEIRSRIQKLYEAGILQIRWEIQQNSREFVGKPQRFAHCYTICAKVLCFFSCSKTSCPFAENFRSCRCLGGVDLPSKVDLIKNIDSWDLQYVFHFSTDSRVTKTYWSIYSYH